MSKDKYLKPILRQTSKNILNVAHYEDKFEELSGFLKTQFYTDKISNDTYEYVYNLIYDMLEIFYEVGGIEL